MKTFFKTLALTVALAWTTAICAQDVTATLSITVSSPTGLTSTMNLLELTTASPEFDEGLDVETITETTSPYISIYALSNGTRLSTMATNSLNNITLGFICNTTESEFTLTFSNVKLSNQLYLNDAQNLTRTPIAEGATYTFSCIANTIIEDRFTIQADVPTAYFINSLGWESVRVAMWVWQEQENNWVQPTQGVEITQTADQVNGYDIYACSIPADEDAVQLRFSGSGGSSNSSMTTSIPWSAQTPYICPNGTYDNDGYAQVNLYASLEDYLAAPGGTQEEETPVIFTNEDFASQITEEPTKLVFEKEGVTISCTQATGNTRALICSEKSEIMISAETTISRIKFEFLSANYSGGLEGEYTVNATDWTGSIASQAYITQIIVIIARTTVEPASCPYYGMCGDSVSWELGCDSVLTISGKGAMYETFTLDEQYLEQVTRGIVGEGVTSIAGYTFGSCVNMTEVKMANSVTSIGVAAFADCASLKAITIPTNVTNIGMYAFSCPDLQSITSEAVVPPTITENTFQSVNPSIPVYVPEGSVADYQKANYWREFTNIQGIQGTNTVSIFGLDIVIPDTIGEGVVDILSDSTLLYNPEENTLTFNGLTLEVGEDEGTAINYSGEEPLTIVLNDESAIIADTVIASTGDIVITGTGSLVVEGTVPIIGVPEASITFESNLHVKSLPSAAAVRRRIRGIKSSPKLDETGGPALSGFGSADFNKVNVSPSDAAYGPVTTTDGNGEETTINALYVQNSDGSQEVVTEFTLTAKNENAVDHTRTKQAFDPAQPMFNILGIQVDESYRGIIIQNGQTYLIQ